MLVSDGTAEGVLVSPYRPDDLADYAVEAEIQVVGECRFNRAFGLFARASEAGFYSAHSFNPVCEQYGRARIHATGDRGPLRETEFDPGPGWHTYRLEVQGNAIRFLVDGILLAEVADNRYLNGGDVGIYNNGIEFNVRSFRVIAQ